MTDVGEFERRPRASQALDRNYSCEAAAWSSPSRRRKASRSAACDNGIDGVSPRIARTPAIGPHRTATSTVCWSSIDNDCQICFAAHMPRSPPMCSASATEHRVAQPGQMKRNMIGSCDRRIRAGNRNRFSRWRWNSPTEPRRRDAGTAPAPEPEPDPVNPAGRRSAAAPPKTHPDLAPPSRTPPWS
jgi:hypothetical protein